jgi:hypothetical protein
VKASIGGLPAEVLFAGLTFAGVFQVNLRVPDGVPDGELPVVLTTEGRSTQPGAVLTSGVDAQDHVQMPGCDTLLINRKRAGALLFRRACSDCCDFSRGPA